jgi:hypothetical protein
VRRIKKKNELDGVRNQLVLLWPMTNDTLITSPGLFSMK